jgi:rhamnosyltransferase
VTKTGGRRIGAVIAAYNPDQDLLSNAAAIMNQVDELIVVDDGSNDSSASSIFTELENSGAKVLRMDTNSGIAAAMNGGIQALRHSANAPQFVLTFDQDSLPVPDYVAHALATYEKATAAGQQVGFVCAASFSDHSVPTLGNKDGISEAFDPMQSGFFIPLTTLAAVGDFESGFFIDCVDSEFTARTRAAGYSVLVGEGCDVQHRLGARIPARILGRPVRFRGADLSFNYYSPLRMYYIIRNGTTLTRRYWRKAPSWVVRRLIEDAKAHLLRFAFSPDRRHLTIAAWHGLVDSCRGRHGRISPELVNRFVAR